MFEKFISIVLTIAALAIAIVLVRREFRDVSDPALVTERMTKAESFDSLIAAGVTIGPAAARVRLVEFGDFECPFCRKFHQAFEGARAQFPEDVSLTFIHYPLTSHKFARPAGLAAECARRQGRFEEFAHLLFEKQDSLGLLAWSTIAQRAGVDSIALLACLKDPSANLVVEAGRQLGDRVGVEYTPTVLINGWRYALPPNQPDLINAIKAVLAGRAFPEAAFPKAAAGR